jgi:hypothetical protein
MDGAVDVRPRWLSVGSLNTWGPGVRMAERYGAIGEGFEAAGVEVVNLQEVHSYYHLGLPTRRMPSYRYMSYKGSVVGPAGGLVTCSRIPFSATKYERFPVPSATITTGLPRFARLRALLKGALVTRLDEAGVCVVNTHLLANVDGDWSESSRNQLVDAFGGECPPTFHAEYLDPGSTPHCVDLILSTGVRRSRSSPSPCSSPTGNRCRTATATSPTTSACASAHSSELVLRVAGEPQYGSTPRRPNIGQE